LFSKTSRGPGNREYMVGYLGGVRVVIFRVHDPQPDCPTHTMFLRRASPDKIARLETPNVAAPATRPYPSAPMSSRVDHPQAQLWPESSAPRACPIRRRCPEGGDEVPW
jgi:hypothetical protein